MIHDAGAVPSCKGIRGGEILLGPSEAASQGLWAVPCGGLGDDGSPVVFLNSSVLGSAPGVLVLVGI